MMPDRLRLAYDTASVVTVTGAAAVTAVLDLVYGIVDPLLVTVGVLWTLDMLGGMLRAILMDGVRSISLAKFGRGVGKAAAVSIAVILCALLEGVQEEALGGTHIPLVAPVLMGGVALFAWSILGQVVALWPDFGAHMESVLDRWQRTREHDGEGDR